MSYFLLFEFIHYVELSHKTSPSSTTWNVKVTSIAAINDASSPNIEKDLEGEPIFDDVKEVTTVKDSASNGPVRHAVVHVGPHKTGSTTIQHMAHATNKQLREDNYHVVVAPFPSCFIAYDDRCADEQLLSFSYLFENGNNLFITAENFDNPDIDLKALKKFLDHWDKVTIVIYYRRFFDWLQSFHYEAFKKRNRKGFDSPTILNQMTNLQWRRYKKQYFTYALAERYKEYFDNVVIKNFHDKESDVYESLFCDDLPNADKACQKVRELDTIVANVSAGVPYEVIARYALAANLIKGEHSDLAMAIQEAHNRIRDGNTDDFIFNCPSEDILNELLNDSLMMEEELFPEFFATPAGEKALRDTFEKEAKTKMCEIDRTTLDKPVWKQIFEELN